MRLNPLLIGVFLTLAWVGDAAGQGRPMPVEVAAVERGPVEVSRPLVATLEAVTNSRLAAEEAGLVRERFFEEGQSIKAGDLLVRLDDELLQLRANAVRAKLQSQRAAAQRAEFESANAERELVRQQSLFERNISPEKEFLDAQTDAERAIAFVNVAKANVAEAEAELAEVEALLRKAEIFSPFDGTVAARHVEVGQWIGQGDPVADVVALDRLWVTVDVPEGLLAQIAPGTPLRVVLQAAPDEPFDVAVSFALPQADAATRSFKAKALLDNTDGRLRPGFLGRATIVSKRADLLTVPKDALVFSGESVHVVAVRDGAAAIVPVTVLDGVGASVAVEGDLTEGEQVVTRGNEMLAPGMPLQLPGPPQ
ncbi:MAG: efflux RND transporter periplasmic adaptor subunit [Planctomycetota bacterium]